MYPTRAQIAEIQAAYRNVCQERGHSVDEVVDNNSTPVADRDLSKALSLTHWLAEAAAVKAAQDNQVHVAYALGAENWPA